MPTYDYECAGCGYRFEKFQSITVTPMRKCPACGLRRLHRLIGPGGAILFKGSGFYATDYRSREYNERASAEKSSSKSPDKPHDKKSSRKGRPDRTSES